MTPGPLLQFSVQLSYLERMDGPFANMSFEVICFDFMFPEARVHAQGMSNGVFPVAGGIVEIGEMITHELVDFRYWHMDRGTIGSHGQGNET